MAGIGFDAHAAARVRPALKARIGIAAYYLETIRTLIGFPCTRFTVDADGEVLGATSCVVANARSYGGGLVLTPSADMRDGMFELLVLDTARKADYFRFLLAARLGRPLDFPFVQRRRARLVRVSGPRGLWVQVDGEPIGTLPVELELNPSAFPLVVPR
ncbi:MAG: hypothetical protein FJW35_14420 [Acidobacteria bacterium]|nr:hypothetical protein [Acidobacteriota bacterium]